MASLSNTPSIWHGIPENPPDKILNLTKLYKEDKYEKKVNLGVGAYRDEAGAPWVLQSVFIAEERISARRLDKEYCPIGGVPEFVEGSMRFAYGKDCTALKEGRIAAVQAISGTGGCRLGGELIAKFYPDKVVYIPDPTWGNHFNVFKNCGLKVQYYRYYDNVNKCLDFDGMKNDLYKANNGSVFLIHSCAHNPTGCDPSI
jgi:aspartate aminotransferase